MRKLEHDVQVMLEAARSAGVPTLAERKRIRRAVLLRVATVGGVSAAAGSAAAMTLPSKVLLSVLAVSALGGGTAALWTRKAGPAETSVAQRDVRSTTPTRSQEAPGAPALLEEQRPESPSVEMRRRPLAKMKLRGSETDDARPGSASTDLTVDRLNQEMVIIRQAHDALRAGLPRQALRWLAECDRRFARGVLVQERQAIAAIATCQANPGLAATRLASQFLAENPESPLAQRVCIACRLCGTATPRANESNASPKLP